MSRYALPAWLDAVLPSVRAHNVLDVGEDDPEQIVLYWARTGEREPLGTDLEVAYDLASWWGDLGFSEELCAARRERLLGGVLTVPARRGSRLLMESHDVQRLGWLVRAWEDFLVADARWREDRSDFLMSYAWLDRHPAFWVRETRGRRREELTREDAWCWKTAGHMVDSLWVMPGRYGTDGVLFAMETGAHVPDAEVWEDGKRIVFEGAYLEHFHDLRLDVLGASYEEATVRLAAKVDRFFAVDGSERPDVAYERSAVERLLEERLAEISGGESAEKDLLRRPFLPAD